MIAATHGPAGGMLASLPRRLAATAYEALLLGAIVLCVGFALLPIMSTGPMPLGDALPSIPSMAGRALSLAVIVLACGAYCVWLWSGGRRTLPMKTWGLSLENVEGSVIAPARAAARYAAWWMGAALAIAAAVGLRGLGHPTWALSLLGLNYVWALFDPERLFLHDRIAGTRLVTGAPRSPLRERDAVSR